MAGRLHEPTECSHVSAAGANPIAPPTFAAFLALPLPVLALDEEEVEEGEEVLHRHLRRPYALEPQVKLKCEEVLEAQVYQPLQQQVKPQRFFLDGERLDRAVEHALVQVGQNVQLKEEEN